jgi:N6-L-threonylcarbamoyladenine synthase
VPEGVAVTTGPGLIGALLVGLRFAAAFAWARRLPLIAVDHLDGHLASPFLDDDGGPARSVPSMVLGLVASGGHSGWYLMEPAGTTRLSRTRDDAAGECFDKIAQVLGLGYPGGPVLDTLARGGDPEAVPLPTPRLRDSRVDFSFSGIKSAAVRWIRKHGLETSDPAPPTAALEDLAASLERRVVDHLLGSLDELVSEFCPEVLTVSGGVAANTLLRKEVSSRGAALGVEVLLPPPALTTDNAAMIARAGQLAFRRGLSDDPRRVDARARKSWQPPGMRRELSPENVFS